MNPITTSAFDLPDHLIHKTEPNLIAGDEQHFAAIGQSLAQTIADLSDRLDAERKAEPVIRSVLPDANVPTSIRSSGAPVVHGSASQLGSIIDNWLAAHADGIACVIGTRDIEDAAFRAVSRDKPQTFGGGIEEAVDRYVAMTRATQQLVCSRAPETACLDIALEMSPARARVSATFRVAYLVSNTIMNLTTQDDQVACFGNTSRCGRSCSESANQFHRLPIRRPRVRRPQALMVGLESA